MRNELTRTVLNHEITTLLAVDKEVKRLWMRANPALGTMTFTVTGPEGRAVCETLSLEKAINAYNDLGKERAA